MRIEIPFQAVVSLLAVQFAVFGWRVQREISLMEQDRRTWLLLEDYANLVCMILVLFSCIIYPLALTSGTAGYPLFSRGVFVAACTVLISYPVCLAAHYGLFIGQHGRPKTRLPDGTEDWAYVGCLEGVFIFGSWLIALLAGIAAYRGWF